LVVLVLVARLGFGDFAEHWSIDLKTALITGASGQDGHYLIEYLLGLGYKIHAQKRSGPSVAQGESIEWHVGNPADSGFVEDLIVSAKPDEIFNLAAVSRPVESWQASKSTSNITAFLPHLLCELIVKHRPRCRLFQASSSDMFGRNFDPAQDEQTRFQPISPYGAAKVYAHHMVGAYRVHHGVHGCCGILFNHESPHRSLRFVSQKIAYAAAAASLGEKTTNELDEFARPILTEGKLRLGDLSVRRDFGFAGDYVDAMHRILQLPTPDDYVIGTGETHSIQELCELAFDEVGLDWREFVIADPRLMRATDSSYTCANPQKLHAVSGWRPRVNFKDLVSMMVRSQLAKLEASSTGPTSG
jgi:GDPmannose 4,6-dehydratase